MLIAFNFSIRFCRYTTDIRIISNFNRICRIIQSPFCIIIFAVLRLTCICRIGKICFFMPFHSVTRARNSLKTCLRCIYLPTICHKNSMFTDIGICLYRIRGTTVAYINIFKIIFPDRFFLFCRVPVVNHILTNRHIFSKHITHIKYSDRCSVECTFTNRCNILGDVHFC